MSDVSWTKPKKAFKIKKGGSYKKSAEISRTPVDSVALPINKPAIQPPGHNKRRNPFSQHNEDAQAEKRRKLSTNFLSQDSEFSVSSSDSRDSGVGSSHSQSGDLFPSSFITSGLNTSEDSPPQDEDFKPLSRLPLDWSLKNRATFTSPQSWLWGEHMSTVEAASSVTGGVRCLNIAGGSHCLDTSASTQFHAACLYWQHPSLPGIPLYPRFGLTRVSKEPLKFSPEMNRFIYTEWINSLQAVYQLVKARQCPFFYVCHSSFTCLFRAAGVGGSQQMMALLTPTTSGIRAALRREDVEFTMPLKHVGSGEEPAAGGQAPAGGEEEEEPNDILETLGIEANSLPGFTQTLPKNMTQTGVQLDGKADSLVFVEGVECQSLLNYLLNAKLNQDPGGVPPTVLAPVAFPGAVLKSMKVKEHVLTGRGDGTKHHQIDIQGPIMPHTLQILTNLSVSHAPNTHVRLATLESTASLSAFSQPTDSVAPSAFASANLKDCGLPDSLLQSFCQVRSGPEEVTVIRELNFRAGRFQLKDSELGAKDL